MVQGHLPGPPGSKIKSLETHYCPLSKLLTKDDDISKSGSLSYWHSNWPQEWGRCLQQAPSETHLATFPSFGYRLMYTEGTTQASHTQQHHLSGPEKTAISSKDHRSIDI